MHLPRTAAGRAAIALAVSALMGAGLFTGAAGAAAAPSNPGPVAPDNPTNGQLNSADRAKAALDNQIGQLGGQLAASQAAQQNLQRQTELAEQRVAYAVSQFRNAETAEARAKQAHVQAVRAAGEAVTEWKDEQTRFAQYMQATYADGRPGGMTGVLLTAPDPSGLLEQSSYQQYEVERNAGVIGQMQVLSVRKSNTAAAAERTRRAAVKATATTKRKLGEAQQAEQAASAAYANQQSQTAQIETTINSTQSQLMTAKAQVVALYRKRSDYNTYVSELRAYNAYVAEQKRLAEIRRQERLERARQKAAADRAKAQAKKDRGGKKGGGGSSDNSPPRYQPPPPSSGGWTAAKAARAVQRAKAYLGTMYAWAGGNSRGPTYGVCVNGAAANDCYIKGFDCSGLVMYAWGKNWDHYADTQYNQAGSYHPSIKKLKPGDLLFFGYRGGGSDLHHVAMYVGKGKMIEAPQSNDVIQISSIYKYSDYYGATRPLT